MLRVNPKEDYPQVEDTAYIDPTATIIGRVRIGSNVFVGPGAVIRADEPESSITIEADCNVQDRVIIHTFTKSSVEIGKSTSLAHGCIVHGPLKIGANCFVGFGSVVLKAVLEDGVIVKHLCGIEGVKICSERVVESHGVVRNENDAKQLKASDNEQKEFARKVVMMNLELVKGYRDGSSSISR